LDERIRVLIVDDEEPFATNLKKILETRGFRVSVVFDGFQAVETIQQDSAFDVVVLDIMMPGMDGITALEKIKGYAPDIGVIILTGHATLSTGIQAIRKGANDYLMKPCDIEDLTDKIREAYDVEKIKQHPVLWPRRTVEEMMVPSFQTLKPEDTVDMALKAFNSEGFDKTGEMIFITDKSRRLMGYITKRALIGEAQKHKPELSIDWRGLSENPKWLSNRSVQDILQQDPLTTQPGETLTDIAHRMMEKNFRQVPVIEGSKMIGVVRMQDILHYIDHETE